MDRRTCVIKWGVRLVFFGNSGHGQRPVNSDRGIGKVKRSGRLRVKKLAHLVQQFRIRRERLKAVSESFRNQKGIPVFRTQFKTLPFAKRRRLPPHIDDDVKNRSLGTPDELGLFIRSGLKVHAAKSAPGFVEGNAALDEIRSETTFFELPLAPGPRKESPFVFVTIGLDEPRVFEFRRDEFHRATLQKSATGRARFPPSHTLVLLRWRLGRSLALPIVATRL